MWGVDYPHSEGTFPFTTEALRASFASCTPAETRQMLETTAAEVYGFDLEALRRIGDAIGPTVAQLQQPLAPDDYPANSTCNTFDREQVVRAW